MPVSFQMDPADFKEKFGGVIDFSVRKIRTKIRRALVEEAQDTQRRIYEQVVNHPGVTKRSRKLLRTISQDESKLVKGGVDENTAFTVNLGMTQFDHKESDPELHNPLAAAFVLTKDPVGFVNTMIPTSGKAKKLAIPIPGVSPDYVISKKGIRHMTPMDVAESGKFKRLVFKPTAILGESFDKNDELTFLFARKDKVKVKSRINLLKEKVRFMKKLSGRIADVLVDYVLKESPSKRKSRS